MFVLSSTTTCVRSVHKTLRSTGKRELYPNANGFYASQPRYAHRTRVKLRRVARARGLSRWCDTRKLEPREPAR
jgi:hypothetical protein